MLNNIDTHSGYIAIIGRPNVGKSTLLNYILGKKVSITSRKAQTTRFKILGIKTVENYQFIYVDTPGIHDRTDSKLNVYMNKAALSVLNDVDVIIFVVAGTRWKKEEDYILEALTKTKSPVILVINKVDLVLEKKRLLGFIENLNKKYNFVATVPVSATKGDNVSALEKEVKKLLPKSPFFFPKEQITDRNDRFLAAEIIREKLTRLLGQELPYSLSVVIDSMESKKNILSIAATIYVERRGQKIIIIGKDGSVLKKIGMLARQEMEELFAKKVFLQLWVKVKSNWTSDERALRYFGYK